MYIINYTVEADGIACPFLNLEVRGTIILIFGVVGSQI